MEVRGLEPLTSGLQSPRSAKLSYTPKVFAMVGGAREPPLRSASMARIPVGLGRLELPTSRLSGVRSSQLSYRPESSFCRKIKPLGTEFIKWLGFA